MSSRYERAASLVKAHKEQWGDSDGSEDLINILHLCHDYANDLDAARFVGPDPQGLLDAIVSYIEDVYIPESVSFDTWEDPTPDPSDTMPVIAALVEPVKLPIDLPETSA